VLRIGLTGGIGAGKSTVAARLADLGAVVVDADRLAREVLEPGTPGLAAVVREFGPQVLTAEGALDRQALAAVAFADDGRRRALESITHPRIAARTAELFDAARDDAVIVHDVPLLVEKDMGPAYHLVLVVDAPEPVRVARLSATRGMAEPDALARIRAQARPEQRRAAADVLLDTDRPREEVAADVRRLWDERLVPFERNVRTGTAVRGPDVPTLVRYDDGWPPRAARLAARLAAAAGSFGRGVEHIGSTAVPGLPGEDVVDLQLRVHSLDDAHRVVPALTAAGFPRLAPPGAADTPHPPIDPDAARWGERLHGGADPAVLVHAHVRVEGSPAEWTAVLLRDWLRADPAERDAYARQKLRLAAGSPSSAAYAEAKEPWFADALPRALAWADRTGWAPPGRAGDR
jgi:dephospho-CoA kinase